MSSKQPHPFPPPWADAWGYDDSSPYPYVAVDVGSGVMTRLRWVPLGRFLMGSPEGETGRYDREDPQHWVEIARGYWLAETPCTQEEWETVMGGNPSHFKGAERLPVEQVSWDDCQQYCARLNERVLGLGARLPTEAEWEYACRAEKGKESAFNDGSACTLPDGKDPALDQLGWFDKNSDGKTHAVGEKAPNDWGLYDMHGNVWEWCSDRYGAYTAEEQRDPVGAREGLDRVIRGGCWNYLARFCRSANRSRNDPGFRRDDLGFRLAAVHCEQSQEEVEL